MVTRRERQKLDKRNCMDWARKIVKSRCDWCERCGQSGVTLEWAHIIRVKHVWTRTDERNGWVLCKPCHGLVDTRDTVRRELVEKTCGWALVAELEEKSKLDGKFFDWSAELARLKALSA